jgi:hypothetical protein
MIPKISFCKKRNKKNESNEILQNIHFHKKYKKTLLFILIPKFRIWKM